MGFKQIISVACAMSTLMACQPATDSATSVCKLAAESQRYQDTRITVRAKLLDNGLDQSILVDSKCPHVAVRLEIDERAEERQGVKELMSVLYSQGGPGTDGKDVWADFIGVFEYRKGGWPQEHFRLEDLKNLQVAPAKT